MSRNSSRIKLLSGGTVRRAITREKSVQEGKTEEHFGETEMEFPPMSIREAIEVFPEADYGERLTFERP